MTRILKLGLSLLLLGLPTQALSAMRMGVGYSTVTSGRQVPALTLGVDYKGWAVSSMLAGVKTEVYYSSGIMVNALQVKDWGNFWFGRLEVGVGAGVYRGEKGIYMDLDPSGTPTNLEKDMDNLIGPAFRVAFKPAKYVHLSVEYMMGIGVSVISNAWGDVGMGAIGVEL